MNTKSIVLLAGLVVSLTVCATANADHLVRVGSASSAFRAENDMVIGGGIHPGHSGSQEGELRATAVVIERGEKIALVACDILMIRRDYLDAAARRIEKEVGIPFDNILINATHTHHAPSTVSIHAYERDETFCGRVRDGIVAAVKAADKQLRALPPAEVVFRLGEESSVGQNSRLLLEDGTIYWTGRRDDVVRPTGPFDPELPVIAFREVGDDIDGRPRVRALIYNHSTHLIGTVKPGARSPSFYGLAAQELEAEGVVGKVLFISGAFGSTHNLTLSCPEMIHRIKAAIRRALASVRPLEVDAVKSLKREVAYRVRRFDEARERAAVKSYCEKRVHAPESVWSVFDRMRGDLVAKQGESRKTWLQALRIGDVTIATAPGELFTVLGIEIKRRSPFRYTFVAGVANDYIGYVPDEEAYDLGGYQVWTGFHSFVARGTGEMIVREAVDLLKRLAKERP